MTPKPQTEDLEEIAERIAHTHAVTLHRTRESRLAEEILSALRNVQERCAKAARSPLGSCLWKYDPDGYWKTGCGEGFTLTNEESLSANAIRFCHACGKRIEHVPMETSNE